jgi:hypothetical protein
MNAQEDAMPYVNIKITKEGATRAQKAEVIAGVTEVLARVLGKNPATTFMRWNWRIGASEDCPSTRIESASRRRSEGAGRLQHRAGEGAA